MGGSLFAYGKEGGCFYATRNMYWLSGRCREPASTGNEILISWSGGVRSSLGVCFHNWDCIESRALDTMAAVSYFLFV